MTFKYKYIIYKIYSWTSKKKGETPVANTIFALGFVHFIQLFTLLIFIDRLIIPLSWLYGIKKPYLYIGFILYFFIFYLIAYNKKKWNSYVEEFQNENERERKMGNFFVIIFIAGSILLFFISLPILFR